MITIQRYQEPKPGKRRTIRFEGREAGGPVSLILVDSAPGQGSSLHVHPYVETWAVWCGEAAFIVGDETAHAFAGDIVIAPANMPHRFTEAEQTP